MKQVIGKGRMALVGLSMEQANETVQGYEGRLCVAVSNSPTMSVISGDTDALEEVVALLEQKGVFCRLVPAVDLAAHSPHMEPLKWEIIQKLEGLQPSPTSVPMYSTVTGQPIDGLVLGADYWGRNLREPVLFSVAMEQLLADGYTAFLEMSPHIVLSRPIQDCLRHANSKGVVIPSLKRGEEGYDTILGSAGALYIQGFPVDWEKLNPPGGQFVQLPSYPWQGERYWIETSGTGGGQSQLRSRVQNRHYPILGQCLDSAVHSETHFWEMELDTDSLPYVADHRIQGLVVLPAAAYVDIALSAAEETFGSGSHSLEKVTFKRALVLPEDGTRAAQLVFSPAMPGKVQCPERCPSSSSVRKQMLREHRVSGHCTLPGQSISQSRMTESCQMDLKRRK
jgi:acyl transferase domain-containing protein